MAVAYLPMNTEQLLRCPDELLGYRQAELELGWGFTCGCEMCAEGKALKAVAHKARRMRAKHAPRVPPAGAAAVKAERLMLSLKPLFSPVRSLF